MIINYSEYTKAKRVIPFCLIDWLFLVQKKIPEQSEFWRLQKHDEFFATAFNYCLHHSKNSYVGGYANMSGAATPFPDVLSFFAAQRVFSTTYEKRLEDWANMVKIAHYKNLPTWEHVKYKWKQVN